MSNATVTIRGQIHARTDCCVLFSTDGDQANAQLLPIADLTIGPLHHGVGEITMPMQAAADLGLAQLEGAHPTDCPVCDGVRSELCPNCRGRWTRDFLERWCRANGKEAPCPA